MAESRFGENAEEYSAKKGTKVKVVLSPKYREARDKAIEIIESGKYGITEGDFWILMRETKAGDKMQYISLIISHNGCLKINSAMGNPFKAECVSMDKDGYNKSLVYTYCCPEQGLYEVGEVNASNCKNEYPYAMVYKRMFDRVILKLSKLAFAGIYSEAEADEFKAPEQAEQEPKQSKKSSTKASEAPSNGMRHVEPLPGEEPNSALICVRCGKDITERKHGKTLYTPKRIVEESLKKYQRALCWDCMMEVKNGGKDQIRQG